MQVSLESVPRIDWDDIAAAAETCRELLRALAADKAYLSSLTHSCRNDEGLFKLCETHALDDKIVIYNGLERQNFRVRWRLANDDQYERIHRHRFSFASLVLKGTHSETLYTYRPTEGAMKVSDFEPQIVRRMVPGQDFTIHHSTYHSTTTSTGAVALVIRGPAEIVRAPIIRKDDGTSWFRDGADSESDERKRAVRMSLPTFDSWVWKLQQDGMIA